MGSTSRYRRRAAGSISDHLPWGWRPRGQPLTPCYEQHCPDPTPTSGIPSRTRSRLASADPFSQGDDDARGAAKVAEQEDVLVLRHLAEEVRAMGAQAGDGGIEVIDSKHDAMQAQRV